MVDRYDLLALRRPDGSSDSCRRPIDLKIAIEVLGRLGGAGVEPIGAVSLPWGTIVSSLAFKLRQADGTVRLEPMDGLVVRDVLTTADLNTLLEFAAELNLVVFAGGPEPWLTPSHDLSELPEWVEYFGQFAETQERLEVLLEAGNSGRAARVPSGTLMFQRVGAAPGLVHSQYRGNLYFVSFVLNRLLLLYDLVKDGNRWSFVGATMAPKTMVDAVRAWVETWFELSRTGSSRSRNEGLEQLALFDGMTCEFDHFALSSLFFLAGADWKGWRSADEFLEEVKLTEKAVLDVMDWSAAGGVHLEDRVSMDAAVSSAVYELDGQAAWRCAKGEQDLADALNAQRHETERLLYAFDRGAWTQNTSLTSSEVKAYMVNDR